LNLNSEPNAAGTVENLRQSFHPKNYGPLRSKTPFHFSTGLKIQSPTKTAPIIIPSVIPLLKIITCSPKNMWYFVFGQALRRIVL
jgi:hypothetical protein